MNRTRRIGPKTFVPFRKIVEEIPASQRPAIHNPTVGHLALSHCTFVTTLFGLCIRLVLRIEHLLPNLQPDSDSKNLAFGRMPRVTR